MRFFHLSDLHIGKQLHRYNLKEDQEYILNQILDWAKKEQPDAVVIAGDIYDKTVPSAEAVALFDWFLTELSALEPKLSVLMIAGNHDSAKRLEYAASILERQQIYIAGNAPEKPEDYLQKVTLTDEYGEVDFYLLPFIKPAYVRNVFEEAELEYQDAVQKLLERESIDWSKRNVLVTHQFYTAGAEKTRTCDSEVFSVGGLDNVDTSVLEGFDYVAMGHIHSPQKVGKSYYRYCGTPLKYSVSECDHQKSLTIVELGEGGEMEIYTHPLKPLRDVKKLAGTLHEILENAGDEKCHDYVSITLTDEGELYRPKEQLESIFSHILEIRVDNTRTRKILEDSEEIVLEDPLTSFNHFYQEIQGRPLSDEERNVMQEILEEIDLI